MLGLIAGLLGGAIGIGLGAWGMGRWTVRRARRAVTELVNKPTPAPESMQETVAGRARQAERYQRRREKFQRQREHLREQEAEVVAREEALVVRANHADEDEGALTRLDEDLRQAEAAAARSRSRAETAAREFLVRLGERAGLSPDEARHQSTEEMVRRCQLRAERRVYHAGQWAQSVATTQARRALAAAVDRYNGIGHQERGVNVIPVPGELTRAALTDSDGPVAEAFFSATGCELALGDDHHETVVIHGEDPMLREVARRVVRQMANRDIASEDRVRNMLEYVRGEVEREAGNAAARATKALGIRDLEPPLMELLGRLKFRLSYSQNQWRHALEVGYLAGMLAEELGLAVEPARRAGLLHDIGKAVTHERDGSHALIGADLARRSGESEPVVNAIGAHHEELPPSSSLAFIVAAADALSGARPGARRETTTLYVSRLDDIDRIARAHPGVERVDIMHAGREVRVTVAGDQWNDFDSPGVHPVPPLGDRDLHPLADRIARQIEEELVIAGQVRVTVIQESRATATAH